MGAIASVGRFWNPELMRTFYAAENRGWILKAAQSSREQRERGGLYAVYETKWDVDLHALLVSDDLAEVQQFLKHGR